MNPAGGVMMVDVAGKPVTERSAWARALVRLPATAARALRGAATRKGDALTAAQLAGILAAKRTAALIPLAHPLPLDGVEVKFSWTSRQVLQIEAGARTSARTGVEMEAMVAAAVAALTVYDMAKSYGKSISIESVQLIEKFGGKSGSWRRRSGT